MTDEIVLNRDDVAALIDTMKDIAACWCCTEDEDVDAFYALLDPIASELKEEGNG